MKTTKRPTPTQRTLACLGMLATLSACSVVGDGDEGTGSTPDRSASTAGTTPTVPAGDNKDLEDPKGARGELLRFSCTKAPAGWSATGVLKNSDDSPARYLVTVSVSSRKTGTVFGSKEETIELEGMAKKKIRYDSFFDGKQKGAICSARVVKGT
ncbi:MAG: hypothetical protein NTX33_07535 [Propionibacteriales bacterium]|nr:hypothetical protein [Propionibacteriales bacterium]